MDSIRSARRAIRALARADAGEVLLRLAEMRFELAGPLDDEADVVQELADFGLDLVRFVAHPRVAQDRLGDADRHHHQRRRDDDHPGAMGLLHQFVEMLDEIGIDRFRRHKHQRHVLRLAGHEIALGDVLDMLADVGAHPRMRASSRLVVARRAKGREPFERET